MSLSAFTHELPKNVHGACRRHYFVLYYNIIMFACRPCRLGVVFGLFLERGAGDMTFFLKSHVAHVAPGCVSEDFHCFCIGVNGLLATRDGFTVDCGVHRGRGPSGRATKVNMWASYCALYVLAVYTISTASGGRVSSPDSGLLCTYMGRWT